MLAGYVPSIVLLWLWRLPVEIILHLILGRDKRRLPTPSGSVGVIHTASDNLLIYVLPSPTRNTCISRYILMCLFARFNEKY
jgi:hypothetical protein